MEIGMIDRKGVGERDQSITRNNKQKEDLDL